jgi:hypothetical protein
MHCLLIENREEVLTGMISALEGLQSIESISWYQVP